MSLGVSILQPMEKQVTEDFKHPERPRTNVMWWTRRFAAPLRQTFPADVESSDQFIDLLEQAERRIAAKRRES